MDGSDAGASSSSSSGIPDALPYLGSQSDWREFRAKLVSQTQRASSSSSDSPAPAAAAPGHWAHSIPRPEKGALLLAHPMMFGASQTYFHRAAILLLDHGPNGSFGVILNRPTQYCLRDLELTKPLPQFDTCRLYKGGDVGGGEVLVLHPHAELQGATEVVSGVYMGGIEAGRDAIDAGRAEAKDFRWFSAYAGWGPGQLLQECKRGVWFTAAASPGLLLAEVELGKGPEYWHGVLSLMGGDYAELSVAVKKHDEFNV